MCCCVWVLLADTPEEIEKYLGRKGFLHVSRGRDCEKPFCSILMPWMYLRYVWLVPCNTHRYLLCLSFLYQRYTNTNLLHWRHKRRDRDKGEWVTGKTDWQSSIFPVSFCCLLSKIHKLIFSFRLLFLPLAWSSFLSRTLRDLGFSRSLAADEGRDEGITVNVSTLTWRCRWVDSVQTDREKWRCQSWEAQLWRDSWRITFSSPKNEVEEAGGEEETPSDGHLHKKCGLDAVMCVKRELSSLDVVETRGKNNTMPNDERREGNSFDVIVIRSCLSLTLSSTFSQVEERNV